MSNEIEILLEPRKRRSSATTTNDLFAVKQALKQCHGPCTCGRPQLKIQMEPPLMPVPFARAGERPTPHMHPVRPTREAAEERASSQAASLRKLYARRADDIIVDRNMLTKRDHIDFLAKPKASGAGFNGGIFADVDVGNMANLYATPKDIRLKGGSNAHASGRHHGARSKRSAGYLPRSSRMPEVVRSGRTPAVSALRAEVAREFGVEPARARKPDGPSTSRVSRAPKPPVSILKNSSTRYEVAPPGYICSGGVCTKINNRGGGGGGAPVYASGSPCVGANCPIDAFRGGNCPGGNCAGGSCRLPRANRGGASSSAGTTAFTDYTGSNYPGNVANQSMSYTLGRQSRPF